MPPIYCFVVINEQGQYLSKLNDNFFAFQSDETKAHRFKSSRSATQVTLGSGFD